MKRRISVCGVDLSEYSCMDGGCIEETGRKIMVSGQDLSEFVESFAKRKKMAAATEEKEGLMGWYLCGEERPFEAMDTNDKTWKYAAIYIPV
jgi:hypothetical protein